MGTTKSKQQEVAIDDPIDKKVLEKPGPLHNQVSGISDQSVHDSTKMLTNRSEIKLLDVRSHSRISRGSRGSRASRESRGSYFQNSGKINGESKDGDNKIPLFGDTSNSGRNNTQKMLQLTLPLSSPSPMNSARMDVDTMIITIPASSLDNPSLHGKGLSLVSPMNSARRDSSARSPCNSARNSPASPMSSFRALPSTSPIPATSPASSRRTSMDGKILNLPTIHSALNFDVLLSQADDDYGVGFVETSIRKHTATVAVYQ